MLDIYFLYTSTGKLIAISCDVLAEKSSDNKGHIYMVFEYMDHDLAGVRENPQCPLLPPDVKTIMKQILGGLKQCHNKQILHRDLKCSNVLISKNGNVKLADFGLARDSQDKKRLTPKVITLWYRPPELLLGNQEYDGKSNILSSTTCALY